MLFLLTVSVLVFCATGGCVCLCDPELQYSAIQPTVRGTMYHPSLKWQPPKWRLVHCILFCILIILYNTVISQMINYCKLSIKFWKLDHNRCQISVVHEKKKRWHEKRHKDTQVLKAWLSRQRETRALGSEPKRKKLYKTKQEVKMGQDKTGLNTSLSLKQDTSWV